MSWRVQFGRLLERLVKKPFALDRAGQRRGGEPFHCHAPETRRQILGVQLCTIARMTVAAAVALGLAWEARSARYRCG
jgi:hypothetical protein